MIETVAHSGSHPSGHQKTPISVPYVAGAALLIGVGLFLIFYWLLTFQWAFFSGIFLLVIGVLLLFDRRAGLDASASRPT